MLLSDEAAIWNDIEIAERARIFLMGSGADLIASLFNISRDDVDKQALKSQQNALNAQKNNYFKSIIPVTCKNADRSPDVRADGDRRRRRRDERRDRGEGFGQAAGGGVKRIESNRNESNRIARRRVSSPAPRRGGGGCNSYFTLYART